MFWFWYSFAVAAPTIWDSFRLAIRGYRRPCSDFMDMLRRLTNCRIINIINGSSGRASVLPQMFFFL